jgi:hypothetical protein
VVKSERNASQESKDNIAKYSSKASKDRKDGYIGDVDKCGNLFYPRLDRMVSVFLLISVDFNQRRSYRSSERIYKRSRNFTVVNNRTRKKVGSVRKSRGKWTASYKQKYLVMYDTEKEAMM